MNSESFAQAVFLVGKMTFCFSPACLFAFDSQLCASSQWDRNHAPSQGKLNYQESRTKSGAWAAAQNNDKQWLQVDLGSQKTVRTLATQGRNYDPHWPYGPHAQWVTKYKLQYSNDGLHFQYYNEQGAVKVKANILFIVVRYKRILLLTVVYSAKSNEYSGTKRRYKLPSLTVTEV